MLDKIKSLLSTTSGVSTVGVLSLLTIFFAIFYMNLVSENNQLRQDGITTQNELADKDSLHRVLIGDHKILNEKYAKQYKDLAKQVDISEALRAYLKEAKKDLYAVIELQTETKLQNIQLQGKLKKDSNNVEYGEFEKKDPFYEIFANAWLSPKPKLDITYLTIPDSTIVGLTQDKGFIKGFVTHSNPFVIDKSAEFYKKIDFNANPNPPFVIPWWGGALIAGAAIAVGAYAF